MTNEVVATSRPPGGLCEGPLGGYVDGFRTLLDGRGYARATQGAQLQIVVKFSRWLSGQRCGIVDVDEDRCDEFLRYQRKRGHEYRSDRPTLRALLSYLRQIDVLLRPSPAVDATQQFWIERAFRTYLTQERGLAPSTLTSYLLEVRRFLSARFGKGAVILGELRPKDITHFVSRNARLNSPGRASLMVSAMRSFLRFLHVTGQTATDLTPVVPRVATWRLSRLPQWIPAEQVKAVLQGCDQETTVGQRDYTILLLLARIGLRAGEVVAMTLDDIDWEKGELLVRGKGRRQVRMPLPADAGKALAAYLRHGRPSCASRRVFICAKAPRRGFTSSVAVCSLVMRALKRAGLNPPTKGAHLFRHSLATEMLRRGATLPEISELLRHRHPDTTAIYAKVDLKALRPIAPPWPGGAL